MRAYVALGDSFTAGTGCAPGEAWADIRRRGLAGEDGLIYENLAEHGATSADVLGQVGRALELEPDLVTVVCGTNDLLIRSGSTSIDYSRNLAQSWAGSPAGARRVSIVTATAPDRWEFLPLGPRTRARLEAEPRSPSTRDPRGRRRP